MSKLPRALAALAATVSLLAIEEAPVRAAESVTPATPGFAYDVGPFTKTNPGSEADEPCAAPSGCDSHAFSLTVPSSYYDDIRASGKVGGLLVTATWPDNDDDFNLTLRTKAGAPLAGSSLRDSNFERIAVAEPPSGDYILDLAVYYARAAAVRVDVRLTSWAPLPSAGAPGAGRTTFSSGTPVALDRSTGGAGITIGPNHDIYVDMPLTPGTNSLAYRSIDNGATFLPLGTDNVNHSPLAGFGTGGRASALAIDPKGRLCFSDLNGLAISVGCTVDGGRTFTATDPLVFDPSTPVIGRQWQAATPQTEQFIAAQVGAASGGSSQPGIRLWREVPTGRTSVFEQVQAIDSGQSIKAFNMAVDPTDTAAGGGTLAQAYLRNNTGSDKGTHPYQLAVWYSTDGGATVMTRTVANLRTDPGNAHASIDIDAQGNVYVAWTEQGTWDVLYSIAAKGALDTWTAPVRVNAEPQARTAVAPTIKVGDRGRVFIAYYAAGQPGPPDALLGGIWHAWLAVSTNGACRLDSAPCTSPSFEQAQVSERAVQFGGICLTSCGSDPYHADASLGENLDLALTPKTGQAHVVVTDSSRGDNGTVVTAYRQTSGPSAYAAAATVTDTFVTGPVVPDPAGDAIARTNASSFHAVAADITNVEVSYPKRDVIRSTLTMVDVTLFSNTLQKGGTQLLIATRFGTGRDVFWMGYRFTTGGTREFLAGRLVRNGIVDSYQVDPGITVVGSIDVPTKTIRVEVPMSAFTSTVPQPASMTTPPVTEPGMVPGQPLYGVSAFSFVGTSGSDDNVSKHWLDTTPAYASARERASEEAGIPSPAAGAPAPGDAATIAAMPESLPATGSSGTASLVAGALAAAAALALARLRRQAVTDAANRMGDSIRLRSTPPPHA